MNALIAKIRTVLRQTEIIPINRKLDAISNKSTDNISDLINIAILWRKFPLPE